MATFKRLEDIQAWQKARGIAKMVYEITGQSEFQRDFGLRDQARRACVSVMANIAEGFGRRTDKEFAKFLDIAYGSTCEAQSHLYLASDLGYVSEERFDRIYADLDEVARKIRALLNHLQRSGKR